MWVHTAVVLFSNPPDPLCCSCPRPLPGITVAHPYTEGGRSSLCFTPCGGESMCSIRLCVPAPPGVLNRCEYSTTVSRGESDASEHDPDLL